LKRKKFLEQQKEGNSKGAAKDSKYKMKSANEKVKLGTNYAIKEAVMAGNKVNGILDKVNRNRKVTRFAQAADTFGIKPTELYDGDLNVSTSLNY
jgi:phosphosulfolactate synthase (CoM biosynthesis protein A)